MKPIILILTILLLNITHTYGQKKQYLDRYGKPASKKISKYYKTTVPEGSSFLVRKYLTSSDSLVSKNEFKSLNPRVKHGSSETYYPNGRLQSKAQYANNELVGIWNEYHDNGQIRFKKLIRDGETLFIQFWDEDGEALLQNGNGYTEDTESGDGIYITEYKDSLVFAKYFTNYAYADTVYLVATKKPFYSGGTEKLYDQIYASIEYPEQARRMGVEGKVFISAVVSPEGILDDLKVIKGIGAGCDQEALMGIKKVRRGWNPGEIDGKKVSMTTIVPVTFRLKR